MGSLISSVGDLFGGAPNNASFTAQSAPIIQPVTQGQVQGAASQVQNGLNGAQTLTGQLYPGVAQGVASQNQLTQALQNQAQGLGPNPAQAALAQNTGQNINQQAALAAGQRGGSANVGLLARQIGQQGAGIQQNAIGQAATLGAQQQLNAQQQLQNLAAQQVGQQQGALGLQNQANIANQGQLLGALQGYNTNQIQNVQQQNSANAGIAANNANNTASTIGGAFNGLGGSLASAGGQLIGSLFAEGGEVNDGKRLLAEALSKKQFPDHMRAIAEIHHPKVMKMYYGGGVAMAKGAVVPGNPKMPGKNTEKNDVVPAMLTPKEIVLPLSVTQSQNPGEAAKAFVEKIKGVGDNKSPGDFKQALREHVKNRKNKGAAK